MSLSDLAIIHIVGDYYRGKYGPFSIIVDKSNGHFNATNICEQSTSLYGVRKNLDDFLVVHAAGGSPRGSFRVVASPQDVKGVYASPELLFSLVCWVSPTFVTSPEFILAMSGIASEELMNRYKGEIAAKDKKIAQMEAQIAELKKTN